MRTGAAAGHQGYFHEALPYSGDEDLLAVVVPFVLGGVAAGEPTVVALSERNAELLREALPADSGVRFLTGGGMYARPAVAIRSYRKLLASYVADGAQQIRIIGEMPRAVLGSTWDWWARYESAINYAYNDFPLWSMCPYDTRTTPPSVLDDVARTHPRVALPDDRHVPSETYAEPMAYLSESRPVTPDPLQSTRPVIELANPTPAQARSALHRLDPGRVSAADVEGLVIGVSEAVTNALRYGRSPVRLRLWVGEDRIVAAVSDGGEGPKEPFAGLLPIENENGGRGLWIAFQSCNHVTMSPTPDGFTLRLTAGNPHLGADRGA
jgi:anti-sigma regulatory factor (Ser/Thr protein kinase)